MILLILGLALWWVTHLLPILTPALRKSLGEKAGNGLPNSPLSTPTIPRFRSVFCR